jgi:hypothetical protein
VTGAAQPPRCLVLCDQTPEDPRAPNILAIAHANQAALPGSLLLVDPPLARDTLPGLITQHQPPGIVFCGHGRPDGEALLFGNAALIDAHNLCLCAGQWVHALACYSAPTLGERAIQQGVHAFVGYNGKVWAYWETNALPASARPVVARILSVVTSLLHQGQRDAQVLRRAIRDAFDAWVRWKTAHHRELKGLKKTFTSQAIDELFQSLIMNLRLHTP